METLICVINASLACPRLCSFFAGRRNFWEVSRFESFCRQELQLACSKEIVSAPAPVLLAKFAFVVMIRDDFSMMELWWNCGSFSILWGRADAVVITARSDRGEFGHAMLVFAKVAHGWRQLNKQSLDVNLWNSWIWVHYNDLTSTSLELWFTYRESSLNGLNSD